MPHRSASRLLVLHGLRLKGVAEAADIAHAVGLSAASVAQELRELAAAGLAVRRQGMLPGWSLTPAGQVAHDRALADELTAVGARPTVEAGYGRFRSLNPGVLDACSRWQVRDVAGRPVRNDHANAAYDGRVLSDLGRALAQVRPVGDQLAESLDRFAPYTERLEGALGRARAGDRDYVTKPVIPSFHTVWFELHEDLLITLGLDRTSETASETEGVE